MSSFNPLRASRAAAQAVEVPSRGYFLGPDDGVAVRSSEVKCSNESTGGSLAVYKSTLDGQGPPPHQHSHEDETIIVLQGVVEAVCGADTFTGRAGCTMFLPRGLTHTFRSVGGEARFLFIVTPGHLDEYFHAQESVTSKEQMIDLVGRFF